MLSFNTARESEARARELEAARPFYTLRQSLYAEAAEPKEFWEIPGGHHIDSFYRVDIRKRVLEKLEPICSTD